MPHRRDDARNRTGAFRRNSYLRWEDRPRCCWQERRRRIQPRRRNAELRRIEQVENLGAELQLQLLGDLRVLDERKVYVLETRPFENALSGAAVMTKLG